MPALGPGSAAGPCPGLLAPQPSYAVAALCLSPAYAEAMRLGRASTALATTPAPAAAAVLNVFPNPTTGPVSVRLTLPEPQCVRLRRYDGLGRLVAVPLAPTPYSSGATTFEWSNIPHLAAGLYFLMLNANNRRLAPTPLVLAAE